MMTVTKAVLYCIASCILPVCGGCGLQLPAKADIDKLEYKWQKTDRSLALQRFEEAIWRLGYGEKDGRPYFHPLALVDGSVVTWHGPGDHPWHLGLWFSWKYINGINYWEYQKHSRQPAGCTEVLEVHFDTRSDFSARIEMQLSYHPPGEAGVLGEHRIMEVSPPDEGGSYRIDWQSKFTAGPREVHLDRTPIKGQKGGKWYGGYTGLSVRVARDSSDWSVVDSRNRQNIEAHGKRSRWLDFSMKTANGENAGIAFFGHPDNPRYPTYWHLIMDPKVPFGYFNAAFLYREPLTLNAGEQITFKYRVLVHPGVTDKRMLENEWVHFSKTERLKCEVN